MRTSPHQRQAKTHGHAVIVIGHSSPAAAPGRVIYKLSGPSTCANFPQFGCHRRNAIGLLHASCRCAQRAGPSAKAGMATVIAASGCD
jgi:hypothetical protein